MRTNKSKKIEALVVDMLSTTLLDFEEARKHYCKRMGEMLGDSKFYVSPPNFCKILRGLVKKGVLFHNKGEVYTSSKSRFRLFQKGLAILEEVLKNKDGLGYIAFDSFRRKQEKGWKLSSKHAQSHYVRHSIKQRQNHTAQEKKERRKEKRAIQKAIAIKIRKFFEGGSRGESLKVYWPKRGKGKHIPWLDIDPNTIDVLDFIPGSEVDIDTIDALLD